MAGEVRRPWAPLLLMVASGFAGLGNQIVWTQRGALWLGHESAAVLAVVAAFFGGLAAGALALGGRIERSPRPRRWYAGCELVIALWSVLLIPLLAPFEGWLLRLTGAQPAPAWQWSIAFAGTFALLLPATAAMGATLPAMERITARMQGAGRSIAGLYAGNTAGAVAGVLATAFWLVPALGLARTSVVCAMLNLFCAAAAVVAFPAEATVTAAGDARARAVLARLAVTGFLGIGYEVLVVRVLSQVTEETVYTFAMLLAVYLVGTAAGAAAYQRRVARGTPEGTGDGLLVLLSAACLSSTASLWGAEAVKAGALRVLGNSAGAAIAAEAVLALLVFGPPTFVMGALFSDLSRRASRAGVGFGRALGVNTMGAAVAPAVFGLLVLPAAGAKVALLLVGAGYLALVRRSSWRRAVTWGPAVAALALALFGPRLAFIDVPEGGRVVSYQEGVMAAVSVVEDADGIARLRIDNRQQEGSSGTLRVDARQAWLPLLLHPAPRAALFLGLGTGVTAASAAEDPTLDVEAVELLPEVIAASAHFRDEVGERPLRVTAADARRHVRATDRHYDVIVSDNFHPARSGSGALYTIEHFQAVRGRLQPDGLFCQWLPLHQLDLDTLRSIVRSFLAAYPRGGALLASNSLDTPVLGLVGRADDGRFEASALHDRLARAALSERLVRLGLEDDLAVLGAFVAGPAALSRFAADAPANTDDRPVVAYRAPRITYAPDSTPRDRLITLLRALAVSPDELFAAPDPAWGHRLAAYWTARDRFIESGRAVRPSGRVEEMLAQVREPLLSVLRISPDFRPAYDPLLAMATALARSDASGARTLLTELSTLQPARAEAARALSLIAPSP